MAITYGGQTWPTAGFASAQEEREAGAAHRRLSQTMLSTQTDLAIRILQEVNVELHLDPDVEAEEVPFDHDARRLQMMMRDMAMMREGQ